ncbi:MAG TPA: hypothetical protein VGZ47_21640 [Gemmataceae bacterium]|nr:hypothetical protein [Gemmataceae bacterium]
MTALSYVVTLVLLAVPFAQEQRLGEAVCRLQVDSTDVSLSGELRLTVSVEGPAPVEVEAPMALTGSPDWRVRPGRPTVTQFSGGRERFEQSFQLEPFQVGDKVSLPLEPWHFRTKNEVRDWTLTWSALDIRVHSTVPEPDLSFARPITSVEKLPQIPERRLIWPAVVLTLAVLGATALSSYVLWHRLRHKKQPAGSPLQIALGDLKLLESGEVGPERLPQLADLLRRFLEEQFSLSATRQTSTEFCAALQQTGIGVPVVPLLQILDVCDQVKFAGHRPDAEMCRLQFVRARQWLAETLQPALIESVSEGNRKK